MPHTSSTGGGARSGLEPDLPGSCSIAWVPAQEEATAAELATRDAAGLFHDACARGCRFAGADLVMTDFLGADIVWVRGGDVR